MNDEKLNELATAIATEVEAKRAELTAVQTEVNALRQIKEELWEEIHAFEETRDRKREYDALRDKAREFANS